MLRAIDILDFEPVNGTDSDKVESIYTSITKNGWTGAPILTYGNCLITGSHRLAALAKMFDDGYDMTFDCAVDVTDILEDRIAVGMTWEDIYENLDYLRIIFTGTRIEEYKNEIEEW